MSLQNAAGNPVPFSTVPAPQIWALGDQPVYQVITENNWSRFYAAAPQGANFSASIFVVASLGMKPNPGYRVNIAQISRQGDEVTVSVEQLRPAAGQIYAQVLVHPVAVAEIKKSDLHPYKSLQFSFVDQTGRRLGQAKLEL